MTQRAGALVGIPDIAEIAGVGRSAVSMWRKRHADFPLPRLEAPSGAMFDLAEVESWLIEKGKLEKPSPPSFTLWHHAQALRGVAKPDQLYAFVIALLVYFEASDRAVRDGAPFDGAETWATLSNLPPATALRSLQQSAAKMEASNVRLDGLISPALDLGRWVAAEPLIQIVGAVHEAVRSDPGEPLLIFEEARSRLSEYDRFSQEFATPHDLSYLMARLAGSSARTIFDPAVGTGGLLLMWAVMQEDAEQPKLVGHDVSADAVTLARAAFFLYDVEAELVPRNTLTGRDGESVKADLVLCDPPYGLASWGDAQVYTDPRWGFGPPPPNSANWAWMQLAYLALNPSGRAIVVLPAVEASSRGREQKIRLAMLEAGAIETVVMLPPRLRRNTSIALSVWILRRRAPEEQNEVLLVDASSLGSPGRSVHTFEEGEIDRVVALVDHWRDTGDIRSPDADLATAVAWDRAAGNGADLNPRNYLTSVAEDVADIVRRAEHLREKVETSAIETSQATQHLLALLKDVR